MQALNATPRQMNSLAAFAKGAPRTMPTILDQVQVSDPTTPRHIKGYDLSNLDTSIKPGQDFFHYAVGGYFKQHPLPADKAIWGIDPILAQQANKQIQGILDGAAQAHAAPGSNEQKIGDFYRSALDSTARDAAGAAPLKPEMDRIAALQSSQDLQDEVAHLHATGIGAVFGFGSGADAKNPTQVIAQMAQGGLGLPNREYYTVDSDKNREVRNAYVAHIGKMFTLMGQDPATAAATAQKVMSVETKLAQIGWSDEQLRDPNATYNVMDRSQVAALAPNFNFHRYLTNLGVSSIDKVNVATPSFFSDLSKALAPDGIPMSDWKAYLQWQVLNESAAYLSKPFTEEDFAFKGGVLSGLKQDSSPTVKAVGLVNDFLGEAVGQKYVEKYFPPAAKAAALDLINNIKDAVRDKIKAATWMSDPTKKEALAKVDTLNAKIGYPDKWTDYSALTIDGGLLMDNVNRVRAWSTQQDLQQIGKPVDKTAWGMTPQTVNAYYDPTGNEIVFPAAQLQPPYFDANNDAAQNYGGIGAVIGHELTHGFDDSGSQFDSQGVLRQWWQPEDLKQFNERAEGVATQFDGYTFDGQKVSGHKVEGEAIADLGGLELAYAAYKKAAAKEGPVVADDGMTSDQRFFVSFAQTWAEQLRPEFAHQLITRDVHPLPEFRANGTVQNIPAFYEAFNLGPAPEVHNHLWDN